MSSTDRPAANPQAPDRADARATAEAVLRDPRYQKSLEDKPLTLKRDWGHASPFVQRSFEILAVLAIVLVAIAIAAALWRRRRRATALVNGESGAAGATTLPGPSLVQAEALAAEGRYAEGVHLLLLLSLGHVLSRERAADHPALTSREMLRHLAPRLSPERRRALGEMVALVEISLFGGRPVGADDFARCRTLCLDTVQAVR
ncbi:MAG: DUF4129 domain-containing protein [Candidatus Eisenbacteria bacterium]|uniref:DUF4129 domain-containing protein n=1 Tax=Eiseniibacteriota bacterium TaxID=2212470 RepID=A0A933WBF3_UNCEI|nr:DUF4129 domain-containing protein [Candidatus Eisenbacteria bacterium]